MCVLKPAAWSRVSRSSPIRPHRTTVASSRTTTSTYEIVTPSKTTSRTGASRRYMDARQGFQTRGFSLELHRPYYTRLCRRWPRLLYFVVCRLVAWRGGQGVRRNGAAGQPAEAVGERVRPPEHRAGTRARGPSRGRVAVRGGGPRERRGLAPAALVRDRPRGRARA